MKQSYVSTAISSTDGYGAPSQRTSSASLNFTSDEGSEFYEKSSPNSTFLKDNFVTIAGKKFELGISRQADREIKQLQKLIEREFGHNQPKKIGICIFLLFCVISMNLLDEKNGGSSILGIKHCSAAAWGLQLSFIMVCIGVTSLAVRINNEEQSLKIKYGVHYKQGDIVYSGKMLYKLTSIGLVGGLVAGALGLGGGSIYNPALLTLGVHPKVSGATGMFLVLFSTINTCLLNYLNGFLNVNFALWVGTWSLAGAIIGMAVTDRVVAMTGRPSIVVWVLVFVFCVSTVATPIFGGLDLYKQHEHGEDIFAFSHLC